jgi:hypothetical protein
MDFDGLVCFCVGSKNKVHAYELADLYIVYVLCKVCPSSHHNGLSMPNKVLNGQCVSTVFRLISCSHDVNKEEVPLNKVKVYISLILESTVHAIPAIGSVTVPAAVRGLL